MTKPPNLRKAETDEQNCYHCRFRQKTYHHKDHRTKNRLSAECMCYDRTIAWNLNDATSQICDSWVSRTPPIVERILKAEYATYSIGQAGRPYIPGC